MPQDLVHKRLTALLTAALLALLPLPVLAAAPLGLPEGWRLGDAPTTPDGKPRWAYRTPTDRKGTYLHGASGQIETASDWEETARRQGCVAGTGANAGWSPLPGREYWYYEADGEGLLLLRTHEFALDSKCKDVIRDTDTVERVLIGKNGFTRFTPGKPGWIAETHHFAAYRYAPGNDVMIGNGWPPLAYFAVRKRKLSDSNVGQKIGKWEWKTELYGSGGRFDTDANTTRLGGYALLNLYGSYKPSRDWSVFARANNILDKDYATALGYETASANVFLGVRYTPQ